MTERRMRRMALIGGLLGACFPAFPGCAMLNGFFDPTAVGQYQKLDYTPSSILRVLTPLDGPSSHPNATEPTAEDLVPVLEDYRVMPGDTVGIQIDRLMDENQWQANLNVTNTGYIRIPQLGNVKVAGLTEADIEREVGEQLKKAGILPFPNVLVIIQVERGRYFNVTGNVEQQGPYQITQPELRLLDALAMARGTAPDVKKLYVIRRRDTHGTAGQPVENGIPPENGGLIVPPPIEEPPATPATFFTSAGATHSQESQPERAPGGGEISPKDLEDLLKPPRPEPAKPREGAATERNTERLPAIIFDPTTGKTIEEKPAPTKPPRPPAPAIAPPPETQPFNWDDFPDTEASQRVIEIDVAALQSGDPKFNIIIRNRDNILVPFDTGVFYIMGEINRPGVYSFGGRDVTIKQAIATAGNFTPLAWPGHCEIIRKQAGNDSQVTTSVNLDAIFAGLQPDVYLKPDDIVNVGTHIISPFLFVIRNSFRFTYGFGFVYDRNFADRDSYEAKQNPDSLARLRRQSRGLPF